MAATSSYGPRCRGAEAPSITPPRRDVLAPRDVRRGAHGCRRRCDLRQCLPPFAPRARKPTKGARAPLATPGLAPPERAVPKPRQGSSFPNWVRARRRRARGGPEQLLATCLRARVSTRRLAQLACALGIAEPSKSQVTEMAHGLDAAVRALRTRPLDGGPYSIISPDTLVDTVREAGRTIHVLHHRGERAEGHRELLGA